MGSPIIALDGAGITFLSGPPWNRRIVEAIKAVTLTIEKGETLGLAGESGSGKTTLGRLCLGTVRPSRGQVRFGSSPILKGDRKLRGHLSIVLQDPEWALNPRLRVGVSVAEPLRITGSTTAADIPLRVEGMLDLVGLDRGFARRFPHELSGGQRQRLAIARALITDPQFVVFDEAVSALDVSVQSQVLNLIKDLQAKKGFAALFISHDLAATRYVSHRIAVMYAGEIVEIAPASLFYAKPQHPYSRALRLPIAESERAAFGLRAVTDLIPSDGCPLSPRCPWMIDLCRDAKPKLRPVNGGLSACHRAEEVSVA
jgi:oligopeptide/dipeptide ABC transporter ATP-binding protein